jgi:hypothetical protein
MHPYVLSNLSFLQIRKHWNQLDDSERARVFNSVLQLVGAALPLLANREFKAFFTRLVYTVSAVCIRTAQGVEKYRDLAFEVLQSGLPSSFALGLDMFSILHEELEVSDISRSLKTEVEDQLSRYVEGVVGQFQSVSDEQLAQSENLVSVLKVVLVFVKNGTSLTKFRTHHSRLLNFVLHFLFAKNEDVVTKAHAIIQTLVATNEYPKSAESLESKQALATYLIPHVQEIYATFKTLDVDAAVDQVWMIRELAQTLMAILGGEFEAILDGNVFYRQLFELLLPLLSLRPRSLMMLSFDFWVDVEMIEDPDPDQFVRNRIVKPLLHVLLELCTYSSEYKDWSGDQLTDDQEDFLQLRDVRLGIQELLVYCFDQLGVEFFPQLQARVEEFRLDQKKWMDVEVVLFSLHCVMDSVKKKMEIVSQKALMEGNRQFMIYLAQLCYSVDPKTSTFANGAQMGILLEAVCKFLGGITFLLVCDSDSFAACTKYCLVLSLDYRESLSFAAAKALHKLCVHGMSSTAAEDKVQLVQECIQYFSETYDPRMPQKSIMLVIESLTRTALDIHPNQEAVIDKLGEPVLRILALYPSSFSPDFVVAALTYCSQMVRFCDASPKNASRHYLWHFVSQLWPMLSQLQSMPQTSPQAMEVLSVCFELYGRILTSLGAEAFSEVLNVRNAIISAVQQRRVYSAAAISCASTLVDFLINKVTDENSRCDFLYPLFIEIGKAFVDALAASVLLLDDSRMFVDVPRFSTEFGFEQEAFDEYFSLLYRVLLSWRNGLLRCPNSIQQMLSVSIGVLRCSAERDPLRNLFSVLQALFSPPLHSLQKAGFDQALQHQVVEQSLVFCNQIMTLLILNLSPGRLNSAIIPNVADAIVGLLFGLMEIPNSGCRNFLSAIICDSRTLCPSIGSEDRQLIASALCTLAERQQRRGKALLMDIYKICASESTVDVLVAYADAAL